MKTGPAFATAFLAALLSLAAGPGSATAAAGGEDADARFAKAWEALEVDRRPAEAAALFRTVADAADAPTALRGRALLGIARCERLLGKRERAEALLREVLAKHGEIPGVRAEAQAELAALAGARSRYATGVLEIRTGQYLDLDAGGLFPAPRGMDGGAAEVTSFEDRAAWLVEARDADAEFARAVPWIADAPWKSMTTDRGNAAWVQVLPGKGLPVVRFVTRLSGSGPVLPAPRDPFCVGTEDGKGIDVWFGTDPAYAAYRVERRLGPHGAFDPPATVASPPFADRSARPGDRCGYRITGVTAQGDEGIPAVVQGTTRSLGVFSGSCRLRFGEAGRPRPQFDFLAGEIVGEGGDLTLVGTYGSRSSAGFTDFLRRPIHAAGEGGDQRTPWAPPSPADPHAQVPPGGWILVPLAGGGVARCRVLMPGDAHDVVLDYEVCPDADAFPPGPVIEAEPAEGGAAIRVVRAPEGFEVRTVTATGSGPVQDSVELPVERGRALDPGARPGTIRRYTARGVDARGRRSSAGTAVLNLLPKGVVRGAFLFHYGQGWSLEQGRACEPAEADVAFQSCAGGISSITLAAPGGILNLEELGLGRRGGPDRMQCFDAILAVDPEAARLRPSAQGDSRSPEADVFVLRTRSGGWAKLALVGRVQRGGWTEQPAVVRFAFNPREPAFDEGAAPAEAVKGVLLASLPGRQSGKPTTTGIEADPIRLKRQVLSAARTKGGSLRGLRDLRAAVEELGFTLSVDPAAAEAVAGDLHLQDTRESSLRDLVEAFSIVAGLEWSLDAEGTLRLAVPGREKKEER